MVIYQSLDLLKTFPVRLRKEGRYNHSLKVCILVQLHTLPQTPYCHVSWRERGLCLCFPNLVSMAMTMALQD